VEGRLGGPLEIETTLRSNFAFVPLVLRDYSGWWPRLVITPKTSR
jgi:hypothetical protein